MSALALNHINAASTMPEDSRILGLPYHVVCLIAEARNGMTHGSVTLHIVNNEEVRITMEKSTKIQQS